MPNLHKIGLTERTIEKRTKELFTTGVPEPFKIEYSIYVKNPRRVEKYIHSMLEKDGFIRKINREFFVITLEEVKKYFDGMYLILKIKKVL